MTETLFPLFIIMVSVVVFGEMFRKLHVPWVASLLVAGVLIGPSGFGVIQELDPSIDLLAELGLIFLMFMAGLETKIDSWKEIFTTAMIPTTSVAVVSFLTGYGVGIWFGYYALASIVMGVIFISSSAVVALPYLERTGYIDKKIGQTAITSAVILDIISLVLLSLVLQSESPLSTISFPLLVGVLGLLIFAAHFLLPRLKQFFLEQSKSITPEEEHSYETQFVFAALLGIVAVFSLLGVHAVLAAFFAGFLLSGLVRSRKLMSTLELIGNGLFIPVFFVVVGLGLNLDMIQTMAWYETLLILAGFGLLPVLAKFASGYVGARYAGFSVDDSGLLGAAMIGQLSTTVAVAFTASEFGVFGPEVVSYMVIVSIVSTIAGTMLVEQFGKKG